MRCRWAATPDECQAEPELARDDVEDRQQDHHQNTRGFRGSVIVDPDTPPAHRALVARAVNLREVQPTPPPGLSDSCRLAAVACLQSIRGRPRRATRGGAAPTPPRPRFVGGGGER